jgi:transposase
MVHERIPVAQLARELNLAIQTLYEWKRRSEETPPTSSSHALSADEELKLLRRENAQLREDNTILKKYAAYIAKESR